MKQNLTSNSATNDNVNANSPISVNANSPIRLSQKFAASEKFAELFAYGMELVEETADFLDKEGRQLAIKLPQAVKMLYGTESMRLTTRLMQLASWLLLQRSLSEGDLKIEQAMLEKKNIRINNFATKTKSPYWHKLPNEFIDIIDRSLNLQKRICRLDKDLYNNQFKEQTTNEVALQHHKIKNAFKTKSLP